MKVPTMPDDIQQELEMVAKSVVAAIERKGDAAACASNLLQSIRDHGSTLAMAAGAGDRYDDFGALAAIVISTLQLAASNEAFGDHEEIRRDSHDD